MPKQGTGTEHRQTGDCLQQLGKVHPGWINRLFMFEMLLTVEVLPVRVLHPGLHRTLIAEVESIFQIGV